MVQMFFHSIHTIFCHFKNSFGLFHTKRVFQELNEIKFLKKKSEVIRVSYALKER